MLPWWRPNGTGETRVKRNEFLLQLDEILDLAPGTLKGPELLAGLENWTSLSVMSFMALADEVSGAAPSGKDVARCQSVNDLLALAGVQD